MGVAGACLAVAGLLLGALIWAQVSKHNEKVIERLDLLIEQGRMRFSDEDNDDTEGL